MSYQIRNIKEEIEKAVDKLQNIERRLKNAGVEVKKSIFAPIVYPGQSISTSKSAKEAVAAVVLLPLTIAVSVVAWPFLAIGNGVRVHKLKRRREKYQKILREKAAEMIYALKSIQKSDKKIIKAIEGFHFSFLERDFTHLKLQEFRSH
ncbi:hypothetical protein SteCoe_6292 [Stentor coeruleus]|uniref:Uncharacterized protein n=1 Tax=Stentor coeruleus TaxID=5963 RepID=A0A1R2CQE6_9CILI|nr:hypothetical protein SteCoe_6292 [Stentor coeruleus]